MRTITTRVPQVVQAIKNKQLFLFGARGTGKSTLLKSFFSSEGCLWIDLLEPELEAQLLVQPSRLRELSQASKKQWVVIDEVQKISARCSIITHEAIELRKNSARLWSRSEKCGTLFLHS